MNKYNPNIHHRRSIRLKGYDYSQAGAYFITICCKDRACLFGEIVGANGIRPEMQLNEFGQIAYNEWLKTAEIRKNISLDVFVIMPNHIHGIVIINDIGRGELHSPNINSPNNELVNSPNNDIKGECNSPNDSDNNVKGECNSPNDSDNNVKGECNSPNDLPNDSDNNIKGECNSPLRGPSNNIGAIVRGYKSSVTKQINNSGVFNTPIQVWQRNYHEHIIRNEQSYQTISNYIINNPTKWDDDKLYTK